jgi:hypothetical protein
MTNEGPSSKTVTVHADCVQRPDSTYPVVVRPYKLDISQFGDRTIDRMSFAVTNVSESDVSLALVAGLVDIGTVELPETIRAGQSVRGRIVLNADGREDELEKSFTFEVSGETRTRFTVPVIRSVRNPSASARTRKDSSDH